MYIIVWRYLYSILGHKFWNSETTWSCLELYFASTSALILPVLCCDCRTNENPMIFGISQLICIAWQPGCKFLPAVEKKKLLVLVHCLKGKNRSAAMAVVTKILLTGSSFRHAVTWFAFWFRLCVKKFLLS